MRLLRLKFRDRRRITDDELQFRDEIGDEARIRAERLQQGLAPVRELGVALTQKRSDKLLKGLR